jgi:signal transduction histidine kinase
MGEEFSGARYCSVFLLDGHALVPTVSVGEQPDEATWAAFRGMGPIPLDARRFAALKAARPIVLEDASVSDLIPRRWRQRFQLGATVLVPLLADGEPCGLMSVSWAEPRIIHPDEVSVLGAIGTCAGLAVSNARLFEITRRRSLLQASLVRGAAALAEPLGPEEVADRLAGAYSELIGAQLCAIALFNVPRSCITTIASRGTRPIEGPIAMSDVPEGIVSRVWRHWEGSKEPVELGPHPWLDELVGAREAGADWYLLIPLVVDGHSRGGALLGFERHRRLEPEEREAAEALAVMAAAVLERCDLVERLERRVRQLDALYRGSVTLAEGGDAAALVARVNELLAGHGVEIAGLAFGNERLRSHLGAAPMSGEEMAAWATGESAAPLRDGTVALPVRLGPQLVGSLRVRGDEPDSEEISFLEALGRGLAEVAERSAMRAELNDAAVDRAVDEDRQRMSADLHASVGMALLSAGLLARELERGVPEPSRRAVRRIAELVEEGKREIDEAARAMAFFPSARRGLVPALRALAGDVQEDSGVEITVEVTGRIARLDPAVERALIRLAHEALSNAWRHARCTSIHVILGFETGGARLSIRDNGVGCGFAAAVEGVGLSALRRIMERVGGSVSFGDHPDGGFAVSVVAPATVGQS